MVTIGVALASAYGTAYKMIDHSEGVLYKEYLRQLKLNMLPATKLWVLILAVIGAGFGLFHTYKALWWEIKLPTTLQWYLSLFGTDESLSISIDCSI